MNYKNIYLAGKTVIPSVAQLVRRLIQNQRQVEETLGAGSSPVAGTK